MLASQVDGAMQGDDGFPCTRRARDAGRTAVVALDEGALGGVQKHGPFFPGEFEGALQFVLVGHDPEAPLGVGVAEGVGVFGDRGGKLGFAADGEHLHFFKSDDHLPDGPVTAVMLRNGKPKAVLPLRVLRIHDTKVTEAAAPMIARIATLERLRFENKSMSDAVLEHLGRLPRLVHLEARDIRVTAEGLRHLEGMRSLRKLQLERLESGALAGVEKLTQLEELELDEAGVTGEDLRYLAGLKNLRRLNLGETKVDGRNLRYLAELQRLERLELDETRLDDESLAHLANLRGLKLLRLDETGITSKGVKYLAGLTALERLDLDENRIGDEAVEHLLGLVNLKHLDLKDTEVTAEGIARLRRALPDCRIRMSE